MATSNASPKSNIRRTVLSAYRARGRSINNLWLVYSPKTDSDWILPSDRQLVHWLSFLEANPEVVTFDLSPDPIISHDGDEPKATELDAIVTLRSGHIEWHEVKAGRIKGASEQESQLIAQTRASSKQRVTYRRFDDTELEPTVRFAMRWLKAIGFAAAIRGKDHIPTRTALALRLKEQSQGHIKDILKLMEDYDSPVVLGLLVRLASQGIISLDLDKVSFGLQSRWAYLDK